MKKNIVHSSALLLRRRIFTAFLFLSCMTVAAQYNKDIIIEPVLRTDTTYSGQHINYPDFGDDEVTILRITFRPGKSTGWHKHEIPVFAYVLKGELAVELEDGKSLKFSENSSFSEVFNTWHNGINRGDDDMVLIAFYLGRKGVPLSVPKPEGSGETVSPQPREP